MSNKGTRRIRLNNSDARRRRRATIRNVKAETEMSTTTPRLTQEILKNG